MLVVSSIEETNGEIDYLIFHIVVTEVQIGTFPTWVQESSLARTVKTIQNKFRQQSTTLLSYPQTKMAGAEPFY